MIYGVRNLSDINKDYQVKKYNNFSFLQSSSKKLLTDQVCFTGIQEENYNAFIEQNEKIEKAFEKKDIVYLTKQILGYKNIFSQNYMMNKGKYDFDLADDLAERIILLLEDEDVSIGAKSKAAKIYYKADSAVEYELDKEQESARWHDHLDSETFLNIYSNRDHIFESGKTIPSGISNIRLQEAFNDFTNHFRP